MLDLRLLPPAGSPLVVAVSGGRDSMVLWDLLALAGAWPLTIWHLDHGLRPDTIADADAIRALARRHVEEGLASVRVMMESVVLGEVGAEAAGRRHRYRRLTAIAGQVHASAVVTAHHQDDQAETVLLNVLRGADLTGRAGIAPRRPLAIGIDLLRPLLGQSRACLAAHAHRRGLPWHEDSTNGDPSWERNRIRLQVLPTLEQGVPGTTQTLLALAQAAQQQLAVLDRALDDVWHPTSKGLPLGPILAAEAELRSHAWRRLIRRLDLTADQRTIAALETLATGPLGRAWAGGGWRIQRDRTGLSWAPERRRSLGGYQS